MRRGLSLLLTLSLVLVGCTDSAGESGVSTSAVVPPETTTLEATTSIGPGSGWVSSVADVGGAVGQRPSLAIDAEGRIAVVSQRETARDEYDLVLGYCHDPSCSEMSRTVLASGTYFPSAIGATSDGLLVVGSLHHDDGTSSMLVWSCADPPECRSIVQTPIGRVSDVLALHATPGEFPVVAYADSSGDDFSSFDVVVGFCEDHACSAHTPVKVHEATVGLTVGGGSLHMLSDGSPVVFFPGAEGMDTVWDVIVCQNPTCSEVVVHHQNGTWADVAAPAPAGLPSQVYVAFKQIRQLACADQTCSTITDSLIQPMDQAEYDLRVNADYAGDQLVFLTAALNEWPEELEEDLYYRFQLELFTCDVTGCDPTLKPPLTEAVIADMAATENSLAMTAPVGRAVLCNPEGEECFDPDQPLSQLFVYTTQIAAEKPAS